MNMNTKTLNIELDNTENSSAYLLERMVAEVHKVCGLTLKKDISTVSRRLSALPAGWHFNGDDTAAIPIGPHAEGGYQLLAIEGMQGSLVSKQPWFAGWCSVMVNCSDIAAMGGRPTAVVDALWADGDSFLVSEVLRGMRDASESLGVPIVGGHTNLRSRSPNLAVSILGHANRLLSSFAAKPGQLLVMAVDLRGAFHGEGFNWNAATNAPPERLREDLAILPYVADQQLAYACKDISQAGLLGTIVMMLESSQCGAVVDLDVIPKPQSAPMLDWLCAFPSFGYVMTTSHKKLSLLRETFEKRDIHFAVIGEITDDKQLWTTKGQQRCLFYDLQIAELTGFT